MQQIFRGFLVGVCILVGTLPGFGQSSGSGFFINPVWVLTNDHVVEDCAQVTVSGHGAVQDILRDPVSDLALLRVAAPHEGAILSFRATRPRLAEPAHVLGYPLASVLSDALRVTSGSVSALSGFAVGDGLIQISSPVQPGNSGGPVLDDAGEVIGVAVGVLREARAQNVNFAIAPDVAQDFLRQRGIAFGMGEDRPEARHLPDIVETVAESIVPVQCSGPALPLRPSPMPAPAATLGPMSLMHERDVVGFDHVFLAGQTLPGCAAQCEADSACQAFTFNTRHNACFLKTDARILVTNADAISGLMPQLARTVLDSSFRITSDVDAPGGDYLRIRESSYTDCLLACGSDPQCEGFAYVRARRDCWLKDRIGRVVAMPGVEFGLR
ncbi:MAG: trypsin-like peptidase domain-containing protein [Natronohydrobacter sp.]|nr:trypsin-like peptidase domain-containing protein [Natronohydrobacter sp.]